MQPLLAAVIATITVYDISMNAISVDAITVDAITVDAITVYAIDVYNIAVYAITGYQQARMMEVTFGLTNGSFLQGEQVTNREGKRRGETLENGVTKRDRKASPASLHSAAQSRTA